MGRKEFILTEDLHIHDPHDVVLSMFEPTNDEIFLAGNLKQFIKRSLLIVLGLFGIKILLENYIPSITEVIMALGLGLFSVYFVTYLVKNIVPLLLHLRLKLLLQLAGLIALFIFMGAIIGVG